MTAYNIYCYACGMHNVITADKAPECCHVCGAPPESGAFFAEAMDENWHYLKEHPELRDIKPKDRMLTEKADNQIRKAVSKLNNEVFSWIRVWTDANGKTNAEVCLNYGTDNILWRLEEWDKAMEKFCEYFDIVNGEVIVLYNIHEKCLEPLGSYDKKSGSKWNFIPILKRK